MPGHCVAKVGSPLGNVGSSIMLERDGVKVGVMGLVEQEWVDTLAAFEPDMIQYLDFVKEGQRLATELKVGAVCMLPVFHRFMDLLVLP